jgi:hypothetical protein
LTSSEWGLSRRRRTGQRQRKETGCAAMATAQRQSVCAWASLMLLTKAKLRSVTEWTTLQFLEENGSVNTRRDKYIPTACVFINGFKAVLTTAHRRDSFLLL